jgi:hypothetical protein
MQRNSEFSGKTMAERIFASTIVGPGGCWNWTRATSNRYGQLWRDGRMHYSHRASYETFVGSIPEGKQIDHLCRNVACCNPRHLEPVTLRANILRGTSPPADNSRKSHCNRGHLLPATNGRKRRCRVCENADESARRKAVVKPPKIPATHCKRGHPFSGDNLYVYPNGRRCCRSCHLAARRAKRGSRSVRG